MPLDCANTSQSWRLCNKVRKPEPRLGATPAVLALSDVSFRAPAFAPTSAASAPRPTPLSAPSDNLAHRGVLTRSRLGDGGTKPRALQDQHIVGKCSYLRSSIIMR